jgi:hypothetical protein
VSYIGSGGGVDCGLVGLHVKHELIVSEPFAISRNQLSLEEAISPGSARPTHLNIRKCKA